MSWPVINSACLFLLLWLNLGRVPAGELAEILALGSCFEHFIGDSLACGDGLQQSVLIVVEYVSWLCMLGMLLPATMLHDRSRCLLCLSSHLKD